MQIKKLPAVQPTKKTIFIFQTDKVPRESVNMFDTQNNESMNNAISYIVPKNKTMAHIMSINIRISFVVGISIFSFNKYCQTVFYLMELNIIPTLKQLLQAKIFNSKKNKAYYQLHDVNIMRAFHNNSTMKQKIYKNILDLFQPKMSPPLSFYGMYRK